MTNFKDPYNELAGTLDEANARVEELSECLNLNNRKVGHLTEQLKALKGRNDDIFQRHHVIAMTRQQLISLASECINEARRKGLIEAEGLLQRHFELEEQTDVEMMQGVVDKYTQRIALAKAKVQAPTKLDTRELAERVPELRVKKESAINWWGNHLNLHTIEDSKLPRATKKELCWCGVLLVNGQCQVHTQNWKGDERCNCGRLFSFCKEEYMIGRSVTRAWHTPRIVGTPEPVKQKH